MNLDISMDSPLVGKRYFVRSDATSFWVFLEESGISHDKNHFPFLTNHPTPRVKEVFDFAEYVGLNSRGEALAYLYNGLGKALNYVGPVLDLELKHGFNDHTDRHTLWVSQNGVELLQRAGCDFVGENRFDAKTEVLMTLVGMMHDLGNFVGRKNHSTYSAWLVNRLFGNKEKHLQEWQAVQYAILFHEEPVLIDMGIDLTKGMPLQWALVAADKMHVGRERIGGRSFASGIENGAFDEDVHVLLNSMIVRTAWMASGDRTFVWHLDFSIDQLEEKFISFTRGNERLWMPSWIQKLFLSEGVKYRDSFAKLFVETYGNRMKMLAAAIFLLLPFVHKLEVRLGDIDTRGKVGSGEQIIWQKSRQQVFKRHENDTVGVREALWWRRG